MTRHLLMQMLAVSTLITKGHIIAAILLHYIPTG